MVVVHGWTCNSAVIYRSDFSQMSACFYTVWHNNLLEHLIDLLSTELLLLAEKCVFRVSSLLFWQNGRLCISRASRIFRSVSLVMLTIVLKPHVCARANVLFLSPWWRTVFSSSLADFRLRIPHGAIYCNRCKEFRMPRELIGNVLLKYTDDIGGSLVRVNSWCLFTKTSAI